MGPIAAADRRPHAKLDEVTAGHRRVRLILEGLDDPENLGAIAGSGPDPSGSRRYVLDPTCIDPCARRTVRVSMGEILFLPCCRVGAAEWPARPPDHSA